MCLHVQLQAIMERDDELAHLANQRRAALPSHVSPDPLCGLPQAPHTKHTRIAARYTLSKVIAGP